MYILKPPSLGFCTRTSTIRTIQYNTTTLNNTIQYNTIQYPTTTLNICDCIWPASLSLSCLKEPMKCAGGWRAPGNGKGRPCRPARGCMKLGKLGRGNPSGKWPGMRGKRPRMYMKYCFLWYKLVEEISKVYKKRVQNLFLNVCLQ